jgi:hypothetical protein
MSLETVAVPREVFESAIEDLVELAGDVPAANGLGLHTRADLLKVAARLKSESEGLESFKVAS